MARKGKKAKGIETKKELANVVPLKGSEVVVTVVPGTDTEALSRAVRNMVEAGKKLLEEEDKRHVRSKDE